MNERLGTRNHIDVVNEIKENNLEEKIKSFKLGFGDELNIIDGIKLDNRIIKCIYVKIGIIEKYDITNIVEKLNKTNIKLSLMGYNNLAYLIYDDLILKRLNVCLVGALNNNNHPLDRLVIKEPINTFRFSTDEYDSTMDKIELPDNIKLIIAFTNRPVKINNIESCVNIKCINPSYFANFIKTKKELRFSNIKQSIFNIDYLLSVTELILSNSCEIDRLKLTKVTHLRNLYCNIREIIMPEKMKCTIHTGLDEIWFNGIHIRLTGCIKEIGNIHIVKRGKLIS